MYFVESIECPECGFHTNELSKAKNVSGENVLMCQACWTDTDEGLGDWDSLWEGEWDE